MSFQMVPSQAELDLFNSNLSLEEMLLLSNLTKNYYETWRSDWEVLAEARWKIAVICLYAVVIIFGFIANLLVVVVILRYRQLHNVTNIFICYLAISDITLCVINLPLQLQYQLSKNWIFGRVLCHIAFPCFGIPIFFSSLNIMMIAIDRYLLIVYPFKRRMTNMHANFTVLAIILFTVALTTPVFVHVSFQTINTSFVDGEPKAICRENWQFLYQRQTYSVCMFFLQLVIPISLTSYMYKHICHVLNNRPIKRHDTRRNQRTTRILIAVVATFTFCWLPWTLFNLMTEFATRLFVSRYFTLIDLMLKLLAMSSACINPFLYGWLNDNFKKEVGRLFGYRLCWKMGSVRATTSYSRTTDVYGHTLCRSEICVKGKLEMCTRTL